MSVNEKLLDACREAVSALFELRSQLESNGFCHRSSVLTEQKISRLLQEVRTGQ